MALMAIVESPLNIGWVLISDVLLTTENCGTLLKAGKQIATSVYTVHFLLYASTKALYPPQLEHTTQ